MLDVWVEDPDLSGHRATLKVVQHARVKRGSPVHAQRVLHESKLTLAHDIVLEPGELAGADFHPRTV